MLFLCFFFSDLFFVYFLEMFLPSLHVPPTTSIESFMESDLQAMGSEKDYE